jgi:hypothetical protein
MEKKVLLIVAIALILFLIGATIVIEDKVVNFVNMIIPDDTVISIYTETSSL